MGISPCDGLPPERLFHAHDAGSTDQGIVVPALLRRLSREGRPNCCFLRWRPTIPRRETFVGGGCAALLAGVRAGLGVAPMGKAASGGVADEGPMLGLPPLPVSEVVLFGRAGSAAAAAALRALAAGVRASLAGS